MTSRTETADPRSPAHLWQILNTKPYSTKPKTINQGQKDVNTSLGVDLRSLPPAFAECCRGLRGSWNLRGVCRTFWGVSRTRSQNPVWGFGEPLWVRLPSANLLWLRQTLADPLGRNYSKRREGVWGLGFRVFGLGQIQFSSTKP